MSPVTFGAFAGTNGGNGCGSVRLSGLKRTGIRDVTQRCSSSSNPCNPKNTYGTGKGVEEHTFEATIDFTKSPLNSLLTKVVVVRLLSTLLSVVETVPLLQVRRIIISIRPV
jgi:hypothetical protein